MKNKIIFIALLSSLFYNKAAAQANEKNEIKIEDLAAPNSPAFILVDLTPSVIQTPNTPKKFILGLAQNYQQSSGGFPQNYSAEFAPYWWGKYTNRSIYDLVGFKPMNGVQNVKANPFASVKFTTLSVAFIKKDLVPDNITADQKVISLGLRSTLLKFYSPDRNNKLNKKMIEWHNAVQKEFIDLQVKLAVADSAEEIRLSKEYVNNKKTKSALLAKGFNEMLNEKPLFSVDIAVAHATYGIGDSVWKAGRMGGWLTMSSYVPLNVRSNDETPKNYLNINLAFRYMHDQYMGDGKGNVAKSDAIDIGGKVAFELDGLSIGYEGFKRYLNGSNETQTRSVGVINYKIADNIYINGAFGKDFTLPNKLIALFGVNWGIGSSAVNLPDQSPN